MEIVFKEYENYPRGKLLELVGSKQGRSGIIWGKKRIDLLVCTSGGRHGIEAGYKDEKDQVDGSWAYFGQGTVGDQNPSQFPNRLLAERERLVLLFTTEEPTAVQVKLNGTHAKYYRFEGYYRVAGWEFHTPVEGKRKGDKLMKFHLIKARKEAFNIH